jgi:hypothetical protein
MSSRAQVCHECGHPVVELAYVTKIALAKRCGGCKHKWLEPRETSPEASVREGGWVSR